MKHTCITCNKSYKKKINLDNHLIVCDLLHRGKQPKNEDEDEPIPSQKKMFQMLIDLGQKYSKLEEKVDELNKWVIKKKKKINMIDWLNANITPDTVFSNTIASIIIGETDVLFLLNNSLIDTINMVFDKTIYKFNEHSNPIFTFVQKANIFYVFNVEDNWSELSRENLIRFLSKVHMKIFKGFYDWKMENKKEILEDNVLSTKCDKTLIKLARFNLNEDELLFSKIKKEMFVKMKTDMKATIEYEFE